MRPRKMYGVAHKIFESALVTDSGNTRDLKEERKSIQNQKLNINDRNRR